MTRHDDDSPASGAPSGRPDQPAAASRSGPGRARQKTIYLQGLAGRPSPIFADLSRLEAEAREVMDKEAFAYVAGGAGGAGGAGTESTMDANRAAFERWRIVPRVLRDTAERDLSVELFGRRLPAPLLVAPIGVLDLAHPDGDLATARAAAAAGVPMIFSSQASVPMDLILGLTGCSTPGDLGPEHLVRSE